MNLDKSWTHGTMWDKSLRLKLSRKKNQIGGGRTNFFVGEKTLERERKRAPTFLYDLRRSIGRNSSGQEQKFIN